MPDFDPENLEWHCLEAMKKVYLTLFSVERPHGSSYLKTHSYIGYI